MILKHNEVLLFLVSCASNERHPVALVESVQEMTHFPIVENLIEQNKNEIN